MILYPTNQLITTEAYIFISCRRNQVRQQARLIEAVLARIGRDKPMYSDRYAKIAMRLCKLPLQKVLAHPH